MWKRAITAILLICVLPLMACGAEGIETGEAVTDKNNIDTGTKALGESDPEELTGELTILSWLPVNTWQYVIEDFMK